MLRVTGQNEKLKHIPYTQPLLLLLWSGSQQNNPFEKRDGLTPVNNSKNNIKSPLYLAQGKEVIMYVCYVWNIRSIILGEGDMPDFWTAFPQRFTDRGTKAWKGNSSWVRQQERAVLAVQSALPTSFPFFLSSSFFFMSSNKPLASLQDGSRDLLSSRCRLRGLPGDTHVWVTSRFYISSPDLFSETLLQACTCQSQNLGPTCEKLPSLCLASHLTLSETWCSWGLSPHWMTPHSSKHEARNRTLPARPHITDGFFKLYFLEKWIFIEVELFTRSC